MEKIFEMKLWTVLQGFHMRIHVYFRHFMEANQNMQNYHRLFLVSQERYDKLSNLAGSGGACGFKDTSISDSTSTDSQLSPSVNSVEDGNLLSLSQTLISQSTLWYHRV